MIAGAVSTLARLGVADHLDAGPQSAEELAAKIGAQPGPLYRLMRATASVGVLAEGPDGRFSQTPMSAVLSTNRLAELARLGDFQHAGLAHARLGASGILCTHGQTVARGYLRQTDFEFFAEEPVAGVFNQAMTDLSRLDSRAVAEAYAFEGMRTIVDVGGGHGLLLATILQRHPHLTGTLYEMPVVVEGAKQGPLGPVMDRCKLVVGDMFASVPAGADVYIMKHIIHDWPDETAIGLLKNCRQGVNAGGKLLVVDAVIDPGNGFNFAKFLDLEMLIFPGGLERTETQFREILSAAGWKLERVIATASGVSIVEGVPALADRT